MKCLLPVAAAFLLAACSEPPEAEKRSDFDPGPECQQACAAGYRWALDQQVTDKVKCRGDSEYARGCRRAVDFAKPFAQE